jgi:hypothetical protein
MLSQNFNRRDFMKFAGIAATRIPAASLLGCNSRATPLERSRQLRVDGWLRQPFRVGVCIFQDTKAHTQIECRFLSRSGEELYGGIDCICQPVGRQVASGQFFKPGLHYFVIPTKPLINLSF